MTGHRGEGPAATAVLPSGAVAGPDSAPIEPLH